MLTIWLILSEIGDCADRGLKIATRLEHNGDSIGLAQDEGLGLSDVNSQIDENFERSRYITCTY